MKSLRNILKEEIRKLNEFRELLNVLTNYLKYFLTFEIDFSYSEYKINNIIISTNFIKLIIRNYKIFKQFEIHVKKRKTKIRNYIIKVSFKLKKKIENYNVNEILENIRNILNYLIWFMNEIYRISKEFSEKFKK